MMSSVEKPHVTKVRKNDRLKRIKGIMLRQGKFGTKELIVQYN